MQNLYDIAHEMAKAFRQSDELSALERALNAVRLDPVQEQLLVNMRQKQTQWAQKQMSGEQLTDEEKQEASELMEKVKQSSALQVFMQAEQRVGIILQDINKIISEPIEQVFQQAEK
ncbi:YlbF family regulator [Mechercharimyces sp. CAU 1602]|uniref:YlbF family regulator n=1 Tax=Mechercharimyces sp. CAU 1602 TaxID=2973933 RepID=UPI0021617264|nr:YlbF family regulator [Mechercharimyces sp. CAU 1602]MCS1351630.1 YlbF family regulator [Mechercharimyces sp. CAU 1602]